MSCMIEFLYIAAYIAIISIIFYPIYLSANEERNKIKKRRTKNNS